VHVLTHDAVIIGGGPAGAAAGRLLASWGHSVVLLEKGSDPARGLAESIPPSTQKLLEQIGVRDAVDRAGFIRARGNTVWWASRERRVEAFDAAPGYQVFRPDFDRVLLGCATDAGVQVHSRAQVRHVALDGHAEGPRPAEGDRVRVDYEQDGALATQSARFVLDCSGRAGVVGRRFRVADPCHRTCALVGVWDKTDGGSWGLPDETHTVVETFADGWAWSVPTATSTRHIGAMVGRAFDEQDQERTLAGAYRSALGRTIEIAKLVNARGGASLRRLWACDASLYSSTTYAGPNFALVGDAGSFIDPLSSFGVKKALASAWIAAVAVHTALVHPERAAIAMDFFSNWERHVYASHRRATQGFAQAASERHSHPYWDRRAALLSGQELDEVELDAAQDPAVRRAFEAFKAAPRIDLVMSAGARLEQRPVIRGDEIVLEPALAGGMRYAGNVDLLKLAQMAPLHAHVPDLFEAYCRACPPVPLPSVVGGLSLLVAKGILHERA